MTGHRRGPALLAIICLGAACAPGDDERIDASDPSISDAGDATGADGGESTLADAGDSPADGTQGGACYGNGTCNLGLACVDGRCDVEVEDPCGNGVLDDDEQCDDGADNSDTRADACRTNCRRASCGDGTTDSGEECDGNSVAGGVCATCIVSCDGDHDDCDNDTANGCEVDLRDDGEHCGSCDTSCEGRACAGRACAPDPSFVAEAPRIERLTGKGTDLYYFAGTADGSQWEVRRWSSISGDVTSFSGLPATARPGAIDATEDGVFVLASRILYRASTTGGAFSPVSTTLVGGVPTPVRLEDGTLVVTATDAFVHDGTDGFATRLSDGSVREWCSSTSILSVLGSAVAGPTFLHVRQPEGLFRVPFDPAASLSLRTTTQNVAHVLAQKTADAAHLYYTDTVSIFRIADASPAPVSPEAILGGQVAIKWIGATPTAMLFTNASGELRRTDLLPGDDTTVVVATAVEEGASIATVGTDVFVRRSEPVNGVARQTIRRYRYAP